MSRHESVFEHELRGAMSDPVPAHLVADSIALGSLLNLDHDLAELVHSADATTALAGVRGDSAVTTLTFETEQVVVELELEQRSRVLTGQILPPIHADVRLESPERAAAITATDGQGVFRLEAVPAGPVSIVIEGTEEHRLIRVRTPWMTI